MDKPALDELVALLNRVLPIRTHDTAAYDELYFGEHQTQAMTMDPATWNGIGEGLPGLIALARQSAEQAARVVALEKALGQICIDSNGDWKERRLDPQKALDDIHTIAVDAFYSLTGAA